MGNPKILYWKWDESIFTEGKLEQDIRDIYERMQVDLLYVSLHHLGLPFVDERIIRLVKKCTVLLEDYHARLLLDIDVRNELEEMRREDAAGELLDIQFIEGDLDEAGRAVIAKQNPYRGRTGRSSGNEGPAYIAGAWAFRPVDKGIYDNNSIRQIEVLLCKKDGITEYKINAGKENAGKKVCIAAIYTHGVPDLFSPFLYTYYEKMFQAVGDLKLGGVANDEWGYDLQTRFEKGAYHLEVFPYSPILDEEYHKRTGTSLKEDMIYFAWTSQEQPGKPYAVINTYLSVLRDNIRKNNDWFYEAGKRYFGKDAFIGVHPTLWCDKDDSTFDTLHNGLGWWEVRRDYAQTDEYVIMPIRLAMAHKWNSPVWYNMWYSNGTNQLATFWEETWQNARFGGRTDYLGYECPNEGGVHWLRTADSLDTINQMEERISRLDAVQSRQPDSRVLVVFGMEAVTNWYLNQKTAKIVRTEGRFPGILRYTNGLFDEYLCDLVPSTEISNHSVQYKEGVLSYGTQQYDALIYLETECMEECVLEFLADYAGDGRPLMLAGTCEYYKDGTSARAAYEGLRKLADASCENIPDIRTTIAWLKKHKIAANRWVNGCRYQDGAAVFTAKGSLPCKNYLSVNCSIEGCDITFEGEDFLVVRCREGELLELHTPSDYTAIVNGKKVKNVLSVI